MATFFRISGLFLAISQRNMLRIYVFDKKNWIFFICKCLQTCCNQRAIFQQFEIWLIFNDFFFHFLKKIINWSETQQNMLQMVVLLFMNIKITKKFGLELIFVGFMVIFKILWKNYKFHWNIALWLQWLWRHLKIKNTQFFGQKHKFATYFSGKLPNKVLKSEKM